MKLMGILQRGPKRSDKNDTSPFRRSRQKPPKPQQPSNVSSNSVISIPTGYDDSTIGANTLYEWSVADNAPSAGSAADLFNAEVKENHHNHFKKKKCSPTKFKGGNSSSSDEEEDDLDDDDENHLQNLQYCKLSDSPPHRGKLSAEGTPIRRGRGLLQKNSCFGTPTRAEIGIQRKNTKINNSLPFQMSKTESSKSERSLGPIDVDSFMEQEQVEVCMASNGETNVVATLKKGEIKERQLPAELKGRIYAVNFDDDDNGKSEYFYDEPNNNIGTPCSETSVDCASVKNVGNANSPFHGKARGSTKLVDMSVFSSTRNLGDTNTNTKTRINPMKMFQKELTPAEPEFTFSISEEDLFGSDADSTIATAWLLHDGDGPDVLNSAGGEKLQKKRQWELDRLQVDVQKGASTRTIMTEAAVAGDFTIPTAAADSSASSSNGKGFRNQMKSKFQSIVKKKNKGHGSASSGANSKVSKIDKLKLQRHTSGASMAPLTGIEDQTRLRLGKSRKDNDLSKEAERRKEVERRDIERKQQDRKKKSDLVKMEQQRVKGAEKWKATANSNAVRNSNGILAIDPSESQKRLKNRRTLQIRGQGVLNGVVERTIQDSQLKSQSTDTQVNPTSQQSEQRDHHSYLPAVYDEQSATTGKTSHTHATARIDNTTKANMNTSDLTTSTYDFDPQFPEEDSTAQTPESSSPITQDFSCVLCKSGERTHLAVPCMHFSFCGECVNKLEQKQHTISGSIRCTVCNEETTKFSRVFY
jgi:hypothetical protein